MPRNGTWFVLLLALVGLSGSITALAQQGRSKSGPPAAKPPRQAELPIRTVSGTQPAPHDAELPIRGTKPSAANAANISIEVHSPSSAVFGVPVDFELIVRNRGENRAENVRVEAELPATAEFVSAAPEGAVESDTMLWSFDRLEAGAEQRIQVRLKPTGEGPLQCHAMVTATAIAAAETVVTKPRLQLAVTGKSQAVAGDEVTLTLRVTNPGSGPATGVLIRDLVPAGLEHAAGDEIEYEVGALEPGETREVQLTLAAVKAGDQTSYVQVTADGGLRETKEFVVHVREPQLAVQKTGPKQRYIERPATYSIVVSNPGSAPAGRVEVVDELPAGVVLVEASDGGRLSQDKKSVRWAFDELDAGEQRKLSLIVRPTAPGEFVSQVVATAEGGLRAEAEAATVVEGIAAISVTVTDAEDPIEAGAETTYEIRVVNRGSEAATNVVIQATTSRGLRPVKGSGPVGYEIRGQEVIFEPLARLAVRSDAVYTVRVRGERPGDLRFRVAMHCDQLESSVTKEESTRVYSDE
jgi:uncharacterized repeat protein (TIGR01451 family)